MATIYVSYSSPLQKWSPCNFIFSAHLDELQVKSVILKNYYNFH